MMGPMIRLRWYTHREGILAMTSKSKIYLTCFPGGFHPSDVIGYALAEDGHCLANHISSGVDWSKHDMGLTSDWKHKEYAAHYPNGYELEWVAIPDTHQGWREALEKNR